MDNIDVKLDWLWSIFFFITLNHSIINKMCKQLRQTGRMKMTNTNKLFKYFKNTFF